MNAYSKRVTHHFTADLEWVITDFGETWCEFEEDREISDDEWLYGGKASLVNDQWRLDAATTERCVVYLGSQTVKALEAFFNDHGMPEAEDDND